MQIGRKIYYELSTGNVIVDTGERQGDVVDTTEDQDFTMYAALQKHQQSAVGVLQLNFGDNAQNFATYPYRIDITQNPPVLVWDTANPTGASLADVQKSKIAQLRDFYNQTLAGGFTSSATGTAYVYGFDQEAQDDMNQEMESIDQGFAQEPIAWGLLSGQVVNHTIAQMKQVAQDAGTFKWKQVNKLRIKAEQVDKCTTTDQVNSITWNDTAPPAVPSGLAGTAGTGQVSLSWTANTEIDLAGYNVYQNGSKINTSAIDTTSDTITGLTTGAAYQFAITAIDTDGNESAQCAAVSVTAN